MSTKSRIEWTDNTFNPIRVKGSRSFYCVKVSEGCKNCYAETMSRRLAAMGHDSEPFKGYKVLKDVPELYLDKKVLAKWAKMKTPQRNFVSSMTDVFGEFVPDEWVFEILDAMAAAPLQVFQVLTKRAERMGVLVARYCSERGIDVLPKNIWMGVSVENQAAAESRIPPLLNAPVHLRWLSCEPLLGIVNLRRIDYGIFEFPMSPAAPVVINCLDGLLISKDCQGEGEKCFMPKIDWVVVGGESGYGARPMHRNWVKKLRNDCVATDTAFYFKQWGAWGASDLGNEPLGKNEKCIDIHGCEVLLDTGVWPYRVLRMGKKLAGRLLDGKEWNVFPIG